MVYRATSGPQPVAVNGGDGRLNITATTTVKPGSGNLLGIFVASASNTPTIKVWDNTAASGVVLVNTITPVGATWYPMPFFFLTGLTVDISGTVDCTVSYS